MPEPRRPRAAALAAIAAAAIAVRLPLALTPAPLTYDDGVYGASALAMRAGARPFAEVFNGQGPLYLPLLWAGDLLGGRATWAPRVAGLLAAGALAAVAAWLAWRLTARRSAGWIAAALVVTSGQIAITTGAAESDGPAAAVGALAVALAVGGAGAVPVGLAIGAALAIKSLMALPAVAGAVVVLWWQRGARPGMRTVVAAGFVSLGVLVALALPWGVGAVWEQSVSYHLDARADLPQTDTLTGVRRQLGERDRAVFLALALGAATAVGRASVSRQRPQHEGAAQAWGPGAVRGRDRVAALAGIATWTCGAFAVVALHEPLFTQHATAFVAPLCVVAALLVPWWPAVAVALALVVPGQLSSIGWRWPRGDVSAFQERVVADLRAHVPEGGLVITDDPGISWWAGRANPPDLVDTSFVRIITGRLDAAAVEAGAAREGVCAVLALTGRLELLEPLDLPGYEVVEDYGDGRTLSVRRGC